MKAIETRYKGYRFRSRLEARWAYFMDLAGIEWEYEKEGYHLGDAGLYLPDFFCSSEEQSGIAGSGVWYEIKGSTPSHEELQKLQMLAVATNCHARMFIGAPGDTLRIAHADRQSRTGFPKVVTAQEYCDPFHITNSWTYGLSMAFHDVDSFSNSGLPWIEALIHMRSARFEHGESPKVIRYA